MFEASINKYKLFYITIGYLPSLKLSNNVNQTSRALSASRTIDKITKRVTRFFSGSLL